MSPRFRSGWKPIPLALGAAALLAGLVALPPSPGEAGPTKPEASRASGIPVDLIELQKSDGYAVRERHAGRVVARRISDLGFERAGRLVEVTVDDGTRVEEGELLARLDTRELRARRRELEAQKESIAAELALARTTTERQEKLFDGGVVAPQSIDESRFGEQRLSSQWIAATAALERLDVQLALSELRAPFAGVVARRFADEGTVLQPAAAVMQLLEDQALEVHVGLPAHTASRLEAGRAYDIEVEGTRHSATLRTRIPLIDPATRTTTGVFVIEQAGPALQHGALARVELETEIQSPGFWVPVDALSEGRRGLWTAYAVQAEDGGWVAERRQVEVIHAEVDRAFVRGTLFEGDRIVAGGVHRIVPGMHVRVSSGG